MTSKENVISLFAISFLSSVVATPTFLSSITVILSSTDLPNLDHLEYDLPENGIIKGDDGTAGSWVRNGNRIIFNYDSEYIHGHPEEGYGTFHIWSKIDKESVTKIDKFP